MKKNCIVCQKEFLTNYSFQIKCSKKCQKIFEANRIKNADYYKKNQIEQKNCLVCNQIFKTNLSYQKFCGTECYKKRNKSKHNKYNKNCIICNNNFLTNYSQKITCSDSCAKKQNRNKTRLLLNKRFYNDKYYKIKVQISNRIRDIIKERGGIKQEKCLKLVGCSFENLLNHIEGHFQEGMHWDNHGYGNNKWHIDHILPISSFNLLNKEEQLKCFHYTNLQPLWQLDNFYKSNKILTKCES